MKKINNKAFTLVELLAVIVILSLLALLATTSITNILKDSKDKISNIQMESIKSAAETWGAENMNKLPNAGKCKYITLNDLKEYGIMDSSIIDSKTGEEIDGELKIKITSKMSKFNTLVTDYEVNPKNVDGCKYAYEPPSFANDSWNEILENIRNGNVEYEVGDTKEVDLGSLGKHTLRIANTSTPDECNTPGFSQTACGFVVEFADIITKRGMNSEMTGAGGWRDSEMRTYVNSTIYNSLPKEIRDSIINTYVVSNVSNTSTDKLYLFSPREIWGTDVFDSSNNKETRQLDYYEKKGITESNYLGTIKKYNGSADYWWLRTELGLGFSVVRSDGQQDGYEGNSTIGVSPAFRIRVESGPSKVCTLVEGTSQQVGSKYECDLDEKRTFYVLENNASSNEITLIMDRNYTDAEVPKTMSWCSSGTSSTCNHDGLDQYIKKIQSKFGSKVTVGIPTADQLAKVEGKDYLDYPNFSSVWLYDNLKTLGIEGYWTSTPSASDTRNAWNLNENGYMGIYGVTNTSANGLRPVITVSKSDIS